MHRSILRRDVQVSLSDFQTVRTLVFYVVPAFRDNVDSCYLSVKAISR